MVLTLWSDGFRHDFCTDATVDLVLGVAAGDVSSEDSAVMTASLEQ
ncbi:hypothetical protein [Arthrobacter sp. MI7-26]|nr:hypothetical protein [Arthrobacter sp. MI7-26]